MPRSELKALLGTSFPKYKEEFHSRIKNCLYKANSIKQGLGALFRICHKLSRGKCKPSRCMRLGKGWGRNPSEYRLLSTPKLGCCRQVQGILS